MSLLSGPVAFIDDELETEHSLAFALLQEIRATGRPVAAAKAVPENRDAWFEHWQSLAFVVLDWDLSPDSMGSTGGATLSGYKRKELYDFIVALMERIYCPIFIISAEDTEDIKRQLSENADLAQADGALDARIAVFPKETLMDKLVEHLTQSVSSSPALSALRAWEQEYDEAKNGLFVELAALEPDWPLYIWKAAELDDIDPAWELASVISTNLLNRFNPVGFDAQAITSYPGAMSSASRLRVSQGRTSVPGDRLSKTMVLPGDLFRLGKDDDEIWVNVSPACHTVGRLTKNSDGSEGREPVRIHLIRAERKDHPNSLKEWNALDAMRRNTNSILIHTLFGENPYLISFGDAQIAAWGDVQENRIGRLQQPFVTRVQQMHAAYIQSEGLPRVTQELYGLKKE